MCREECFDHRSYHKGVAVTVVVGARQVQASRIHSPQFPQTLPTQ